MLLGIVVVVMVMLPDGGEDNSEADADDDGVDVPF